MADVKGVMLYHPVKKKYELVPLGRWLKYDDAGGVPELTSFEREQLYREYRKQQKTARKARRKHVKKRGW